MSESSALITSRGEFREAVRSGLAEAAAFNCPELWWIDTDFADWPLGDPAVIASLSAWAGCRRRLTLVAQSFDAIVHRHARWLEWRRRWSHLVHCRSVAEIGNGQMPTLLLAAGLLRVHLLDPVHFRGSLSRDAAALLRAREMLDAHLQRSADAFPVTTTGL